jgi:hypothetical protein
MDRVHAQGAAKQGTAGERRGVLKVIRAGDVQELARLHGGCHLAAAQREANVVAGQGHHAYDPAQDSLRRIG